MRREAQRLWLALVGVIGVTAPARADMGAPWETRTVANYRIATDEAYPDYVFVVCRHAAKSVKDEKSGTWTFTDEAEYVELTPDRAVEITRSPATSGRISFLIVPRAAAPFKTALELSEAVFAGRVENAVRHDLAQTKTGPWWIKSKVIDYRLRRAANDTLELAPTNQDESYQCYLVGCGTPIALLVGSIWLIRRRRAKSPPNPQA